MDPHTEFSALIHSIIETSTRLLQRSEQESQQGIQNWLEKIPPIFADMSLLSAYFQDQPHLVQEQIQIYHTQAQQLLQDQLQTWTSPEVAQPLDRRFASKEWRSHPFFQFISQHYLLLEKQILQLIHTLPIEQQPCMKRVHFLLEQVCHACSPENFLYTNPQLLAETIEKNGLNLLRGLMHFLQDLQHQKTDQWTMPLADKAAYTVGKNLAITPGKVVYQNELIELIQYTPQTKKVHAIPLLMIPPWINKYYIFDLRPENSLVRWLVSQGMIVFVISWRNPGKSHANWGLSEYLHLGPIAAIDAIQQGLQVPKVSTLGFCIGGTLLTLLLAYYKAQNINVIASATLLASLIDFSEPGDLGVFIHEQQIQVLEQRMQEQGYLEGEVMAAAFNALRPGELVWRIFVQRYLFGQPPMTFDLLFWNIDTTNMPAKMHSEYLRTMYLANDLIKPGQVRIRDTPLDVRQIDTPTFFLSTQKDHIALWQSTYRGFKLFNGPKRFVLGGSGHIAGIVNPPAMEKYGYYTNEDYPSEAENWLKNVSEHSGSWWSEWVSWLKQYSGPRQAAAATMVLPSLRDAPGIYVYNFGQPQ